MSRVLTRPMFRRGGSADGITSGLRQGYKHGDVATGAKEKGLFTGIVVGGVIALEAIFAGPISGASMNPARSLGPAVASSNFTAFWIYIIGPVVGSLLAVPTWRFVARSSESN